MAQDIDINEYLALKKLDTLLLTQGSKAAELKELHSAIEVDEPFFITTIKKLEKKQFVSIGFFKRGQIIRVVNWTEKYNSPQVFHISITKKGRQILESW